MKTKSIKSCINTNRDVKGIGFRSIRPLLERDGLGFSIHKTIINEGGPYHWHYKHHLEACFCVDGYGELQNLATGEVFNIEPDTLYILDQNDNHTFTALTNVILISVFNPPITGNEIHQKDGSYRI